MIDFVRKRFLFLGISALLIVPGIVSLLLPGGIHPGIDFTSGSILTLHFQQTVEQALGQRFGALEVLGFESVSPLVATEIVQKSILAVLVSCVGILAYLSFAFRKVQSPWRYGVCAVLALVHDAVLLLGACSLLGRFFGIELDALFITATLTVIGFSVHDTIVVFDRIRENLPRYGDASFETIVNH